MKQGILIILVLISCVSCTKTIYSVVEPIDPEPIGAFNEMAVTVDSLQPTLKWKPLAPHSGTYDVIIYEAEYEEGAFRREDVHSGQEVYYRQNITGISHTVEEPLQPETWYLWSVRRRIGEKTSKWASYHWKHFPSDNEAIGKFLFETPD